MENEFGLLLMIESMARSRKGLNSFIILGVWAIWTHHNLCVFYGVSSSLTGVVSLILEEVLEVLAGAQGVSYLPALVPLGI